VQEDPSRSHFARLGASLLAQAQASADNPHHQTTTNNAARLLYPASPAERARRELSEPEEKGEKEQARPRTALQPLCAWRRRRGSVRRSAWPGTGRGEICICSRFPATIFSGAL